MKKEQLENRIVQLNNDLTQTAMQHSKILWQLNEAQHWLSALIEAAKIVEEAVTHK